MDKITKKKISGFTVMEMFVVLGFIILMMGILIVYNRAGERQIILFREQYSITNAIVQAKSLAIATFGRPNVPCGYGVHFNSGGDYFIYEDVAIDCNQAGRDRSYPGNPSLIVSSFKLPLGISFSGLSVSDIVFAPPEPKIYIYPDQDPAIIIIKVDVEGTSVQIKVNKAGQISTQ